MPDTAISANEALDHAWKWFEYHANQRMTMIRFYLIVAGAIASGIGYLWQAQYYLPAAGLGVSGAIVAVAFVRLDRRVSDLVKLGEAALKAQQKQIATLLQIPEFEICAAADDYRTPTGQRRRWWPYTYSESIHLIVAMSAIAFASVAIAGIYIAATRAG